MKVTGPGGVSQSPSAKPARAAGGGEGFRVVDSGGASAASPVSASRGVAGVVGVEALLALQDVESPTERRRRSVRRASQLLDRLDEVKIALLGGDLSTTQLNALRDAIREQRSATDDPKLEAVLDEIETRAAVELAKLESAQR